MTPEKLHATSDALKIMHEIQALVDVSVANDVIFQFDPAYLRLDRLFYKQNHALSFSRRSARHYRIISFRWPFFFGVSTRAYQTHAGTL